MKDHIAILDFGSQYMHLIARSVRDMGVSAKIYPDDISAKELGSASGIIISGGPQSVYDKKALTIDKNILNLGVPILGLCYGHQLLAHMLGGKVEAGAQGEFGQTKLNINNATEIFKGIKKKSTIWMSHRDSVTKLPKDFNTLASTDICQVAAMANDAKKIYGFQFHPEVIHSQFGFDMIRNFVLNICKAKKNWHVENVLENLIKKMQKQVGNKKVFILVSGGVDSGVAFALLTKALGEEKVKGLYIDTGFMRLKESEEIKKGFREAGFRNLETVDASTLFYKRLKNIYEPERKREIIGQTFLDTKDMVSKKLKLNDDQWLLGQGTIYPDTITSGGTKNAHKIKTHHNRVGAIKKMVEKGLVVEPLVEFYKDEVRKTGRLLGMPEHLIKRHPFPGPGLAIRCLCYDKKNIENLSFVEKEVEDFYLQNYSHINRKLLPIKSVGVQGDGRSYAHPVAIWGETNWEKLDEISSKTTNFVKGVNRMVLLLNPPKKGQFEFHRPKKNLYISPERMDLLREIDAIVHRTIRKEGIYDGIWEFVVVLIPIVDDRGRESIVLRPFNSRDVMTLTFYKMESRILKKMTKAILATGKISYVFYDITNKPPGTTEWE
ncbi:MAG: glutamine-hydrolyzing GMP synthase [Candidatus Moraniibacteriota bacterium]